MSARDQKHHVDHYIVGWCGDGWWYVIDSLNGNRSKPYMTEGEATLALYGLAVRDLINE